MFSWHRFSAYWLRSKCSICSYQLNIWYVAHWVTTILNWFLKLGEVAGACSALTTGRPGIALTSRIFFGPLLKKYGAINCHNGGLISITQKNEVDIHCTCWQCRHLLAVQGTMKRTGNVHVHVWKQSDLDADYRWRLQIGYCGMEAGVAVDYFFEIWRHD